jgi:thiol reductant ABC exporter CydD subunit
MTEITAPTNPATAIEPARSDQPLEPESEGGDRASERRRAAWLKGLFAAHRPALAVMVGVGLAGAVVAVAQAWMIAGVLAEAIGGAGLEALWPPAALALGLIVLRAGLSVIADVVGASAARAIKLALRRRVLEALAKLGPAFLDTRASGSVTSTVVDQVEAIDGFIARFYPAQILAAAIPLGLLVPVFLVDPPSGWRLLAAALVTPVLMGVVGWRTGVRARAQITALKRANGYFLDRLQGLATLKVFGEVGRERERIRAVSDDLRLRTMGVLRLAFLSATGLELIASVALALVAVQLAGTLVDGGSMPLAHGLFLLILVPEIFIPLRKLGIHYHDRAAAIGAAESILEILDAADADRETARPLAVTRAPEIVFDGVTLAYAGGRRRALDDVSLTVRAGEMVALAGESGSGKSSLLSVLLGLRRPSAGQIRIDGKVLEGRALADAIAWAGQGVRILSASLRENLVLGRPDAPKAALDAAIGASQLAPVIAKLPDGLETQVGEGARGLSGGEARRVALARALVRDAPVVLLDEPTANLDRESEEAVLAALKVLAEGRTVIVATHAPAVMAMADRVVRLERGRLVRAADEVGDV